VVVTGNPGEPIKAASKGDESAEYRDTCAFQTIWVKNKIQLLIINIECAVYK
jgi:hypothetical protein